MKKRFKIVIGCLIVTVIGMVFLMYMTTKPLTEVMVREKIQRRMDEVVQNNDAITSALFTVYNGKTGQKDQFVSGMRNKALNEPAKVDSPYHSASIGKTFNAVVFGMLVDEGKVSFEDKIAKWLSPDVLHNLFVVEGVDFSKEVTIRQLLTHTSGVADWFEGETFQGPTMIEVLRSNQDQRFTPMDLLVFTRDNQKTIGKPGEQFYYSDTGYVLLGMILEVVEGKSYDEILNERLFDPLGMQESYLMFSKRGEGRPDILGLYLDGLDISEKAALSCDWAGGGVVTTMDDLLKFMVGFTEGRLLKSETQNTLLQFEQKYDKGIKYGMGMMQFDFSEMSILLSGFGSVYGGVGATGTYMLYDEVNKLYFIGNYGSTQFMEKSIEELIQIRFIYDRMK